MLEIKGRWRWAGRKGGGLWVISFSQKGYSERRTPQFSENTSKVVNSFKREKKAREGWGGGGE